MIKSSSCITKGKTSKELVEINEDPRDCGGYFIIKGNEWCI